LPDQAISTGQNRKTKVATAQFSSCYAILKRAERPPRLCKGRKIGSENAKNLNFSSIFSAWTIADNFVP
jgi:hypothetical protein